MTSVAYRHPGVLLKTVTTLDVLSGGRMYLGVGAGAPFNPPPQGPGTPSETEGLGIPFPPLADRFVMLEELLQVAHQMWNGDESPFSGRHYQLARPLNSPNSVQRPRPPILIAGGGEKKTLPLVARYGDACHLPDLPGTPYEVDFKHKLDVLRRQCDDAGRDYARIEKTVGTGSVLDRRQPGKRRRAARPAARAVRPRLRARDGGAARPLDGGDDRRGRVGHAGSPRARRVAGSARTSGAGNATAGRAG